MSDPHQTTPVLIWADIDVGIAAMVRYLQTIPGVRTDASCQGSIGEGGAEPYRPYVLAHWEPEALERLRREFDVEPEGNGTWGHVHPRAGEEGMSKNPTREEIERWFQYWDRTTLIELMFANEARIKSLKEQYATSQTAMMGNFKRANAAEARVKWLENRSDVTTIAHWRGRAQDAEARIKELEGELTEMDGEREEAYSRGAAQRKAMDDARIKELEGALRRIAKLIPAKTGGDQAVIASIADRALASAENPDDA